MEPFAILFMSFSMTCVTLLAVYCLFRILTGAPPAADDDVNE